MPPSPVTPPVCLTIAGSDCSAGAGIQADLKTFSAMGVYGLTAVTCVVAEVPGRVSSIQSVDPAILADQLRLLFEAFPIHAVKTGMLYSADLIEVVASALGALPHERQPKLVVDPVMVATSGDVLIARDAIEAYSSRLFPMAELITPNLDELRVLTGSRVRNWNELKSAAEQLSQKLAVNLLAKGSHLGGDEARDILVTPNGSVEFCAPFVRGVSTHGTGCTLSAGITAGLAKGRLLVDAVRDAKSFVSNAIRKICRWGKIDALNHHQF
ncbi:MAG: bifunctional hydroxymethylpyrimidine kinase/phosphomethylpyrimidine kinase [Verrucomicrobiales bacterium]